MAVVSGGCGYDGRGWLGSSGEEQALDAAEAHAAEFDEEVDGVAGLAGGGADPVVFFYDEFVALAEEAEVAVLEAVEAETLGLQRVLTALFPPS